MMYAPRIAFACALVLAVSSTWLGARTSEATPEVAKAPAALAAPADEPILGYDRWRWFEDTYWIVPENGIYSVYQSADTNTFRVLKGQTVFHLTDYFNGYFSGAVVVKLTEALVPSCQYVLGQVTPEGRVYMTMYDASTGEVVNSPLGTMVRKGGEWTMVNTMTAPASGGTLSHWAYMLQSKPGDRTFKSLPFAEESIPEFLSACPDGPVIERHD
jgi:hypothetical protein